MAPVSRVKPIIPVPLWAASEERRLEHAGRMARAWSVTWSTDKALLLWLIEHTDSATGTVTVTDTKAGEVAGTGGSHARKILRRLESAGLISIKLGGEGRMDPHVVRVTW